MELQLNENAVDGVSYEATSSGAIEAFAVVKYWRSVCEYRHGQKAVNGRAALAMC